MQNTLHVKKVKYGKAERYSFEKVEEKFPQPYLLEIQKTPYKQFLEKGIKDVLDEYSPIVDYSGKCELYFLDYSLGEPKHSIEECRRSRLNYTIPLKVNWLKPKLEKLSTKKCSWAISLAWVTKPTLS